MPSTVRGFHCPGEVGSSREPENDAINGELQPYVLVLQLSASLITSCHTGDIL